MQVDSLDSLLQITGHLSDSALGSAFLTIGGHPRGGRRNLNQSALGFCVGLLATINF